VNTKLDWNTVIANESVVGRNVIQSNYPRGTATLAPFSYLSTEAGAYNWATDKYVVKDGSNWYSANSQVIAYYMDPRNFLNENTIFMFEGLSYSDGYTMEGIHAILKGTFMVNDRLDTDGTTFSYADVFMNAGKLYGVSPYHLAARMKQEQGCKDG
jgi:beta-N-acetylglucosaminidase